MGQALYFHTLSESPREALILHLSVYWRYVDLNGGQLVA